MQALSVRINLGFISVMKDFAEKCGKIFQEDELL